MIDEEIDDSKYKNFTIQVDKSLKAFEYSTEWADLISAIGRLIKVIQSNANSKYIPRRSLVGKRLAQCLHPALPPGVHCKALECYDTIFRTVGPHRLALDLPIYGIGLFPLLGPSAMAVKPPLFNLFEEHLLSLGTSLRPAFTGLLQGLLPGLEQGAEFSERGAKILEMFCAAVGPRFFYTCLWKVLIYSSSLRHFGISFVINHFNKRRSLEMQDFIYGLDKRVMICSLSYLLNDSILLVQRDALDFLQLALPIHLRAHAFSNTINELLASSEWITVCRSALGVLLRRDASLNRRLFTWFRGGQPIEASCINSSLSFGDQPVTVAYSVLHDRMKPENQPVDEHDHPAMSDDQIQDLYFYLYSREILITAVRQIISSPGCLPIQTPVIRLSGLYITGPKSSTVDLSVQRVVAERLLRILTGLLDRSDLGGMIIESLLPQVLWYICSEYHKLSQLFVSWRNGDSSTILHNDLLVTFGPTSSPQSSLVSEDVLTLITSYVKVKDAVRQLDERFNANSIKSVVLESVAESSGRTSEPTDLSDSESVLTNGYSKSELVSSSTYINPADEFLRSAHLFLNNLDGMFLWGFIGSQFTLFLNSTNPSAPHSSLLSDGSYQTLEDLCRVVRFLLSHSPIDTHPSVCGHYLPRLFLHIVNSLDVWIRKQCEFDETCAAPQLLTSTHLSCVFNLMNSIIEHISKYLLNMFDRSIVFSFNSSPNLLTSMEKRESSAVPSSSFGPSIPNDLTAVASAVGQFRTFFGAFCIHVMGFPAQKLLQFSNSLQAQTTFRSKKHSTDKITTDFAPADKLRLILFSSACHILLKMSNFPLLVCDSGTPLTNNCEQSFGSDPLMELFNGDLIITPTSNEFTLPEWLLCLLYAATEIVPFDLKATSMYTLLELCFASSSIHGRHFSSTNLSDVSSQKIDRSKSVSGSVGNDNVRLILPVLSGRLLSFITHKTNTFERLAISLWAYLDPSNSSFHEDTVNLLARLHQLFPHVLHFSTASLVSTMKTRNHFNLESFILSQMLSPDLNIQIDAHERFIILWDLLRPSSLTAVQIDRNCVNPNSLGNVPGVGAGLSSFRSITARSWRRLSVRFGSKLNSLDVCSHHSAGLQGIPFNRCVLLLLDNLDNDAPWGPMGSVTLGGSDCHAPVGLSDDLSLHCVETQATGLSRSVLRELSTQWLHRALRTKQVDRLIAPILAALLHPATVRISLKALVLRQNRRYRQSPTGKRSNSLHISDSCAEIESNLALNGVSTPERPTFSNQPEPVDSTEVGVMVDTSDDTCETNPPSERKQSPTCQQSRFFSSQNLAIDGGDDEGDWELQLELPEHFPTMLPLHEHLVVHLQNHDVNQVLYALFRIRAILTCASNLFVFSLISCSVTTGASDDPNAALCLFGMSLAELLSRHRIALTGGNFYGRMSTDDISSAVQTQPTLLDVIINLCLLIMCSQLPCAINNPKDRLPPVFASSHGKYKFAVDEFRANKYAQKVASDVLMLIVKELVNIRNSAVYFGPPSTGLGSNGQFDKTINNPLSARRTVEAIVQRTCLISGVLHCLATAVELTHWPDDMAEKLTMLNSGIEASIPCCFRLLLVNQFVSNLPTTFHSTHLSSLIRLTRTILGLRPWSADRLEATPPRSIMSNTIWPFKLAHKNIDAPVGKKHEKIAAAIDSDTADLLEKIWLDAFAHLPPFLASEPIFRTACLNMHWSCASIQSSYPTREQSALLLDLLTLALKPPRSLSTPCRSALKTRPDLHHHWFHFIFATLSLWDLYTPHLVRAVVTQLCTNLSVLVERASHEPVRSSPATSYPSKTLNLHVNETRSSPPEYTLSCLACLQGIYHAFLLPGGSAVSVFRSSKYSSLALDRMHDMTASSLCGFPEAVSNAAGLSELVFTLRQNDGENAPFPVEPNPNSPVCFDIPSSEPDLKLCGDASSYSVERPASAEPSVVLTPKPSTVDINSKLEAQNLAAVFTTRTKNLFDTNGPSYPNAHPLIQAQTELFRLLPTVLSSLAEVWDSFNRLPFGFTHSFDTSSSPLITTVSTEQISRLIPLGSSLHVRYALRMFLQPIALLHPASFLIGMALAWPTTLYGESTGTGKPNRFGVINFRSITSLLTPCLSSKNGDKGDYTLPLLIKQRSLLRLFTGYTSDGSPHFQLIVPPSILVDHLKSVIKRPHIDVALLSTQTLSTRDTEEANLSEQNRQTQILTMLRNRLQTNLLHIFYAIIVHHPHYVSNELILDLLRDLGSLPTIPPVDSLQSLSNSPVSLPPIAVFLLMKIFNVFINRFTAINDRREQRELQELCHRLLESTATIAASALKQTTWFRRTLQVQRTDANTSNPTDSPEPSGVTEPGHESDQADSDLSNHLDHLPCSHSFPAVLLNSQVATTPPRLPRHPSDSNYKGTSNVASCDLTRSKRQIDMSVQAIDLLTEHMTSFLDVVYRSDEKDRIPTFLANILMNIFPYLRVRIISNDDHFTAASKLLASVSSYQYTRRAWRREVFDLLFEPAFFRMNPTALQSWNIIIDNLMTQDKSTFREALARLTFSQPSSLTLFSNKETEHNLRAACLKKLSYIVYASEPDQYARAMPDLLERLTDCLRLGQGLIPQVHTQVFVFARALIARMSAVQLTSLWPIVIPEMILAFKSLSQHLQTRSTGVGQKQQNRRIETNQKEFDMYLSACKLLATGFLSPEHRTPHFSFHQWVFFDETPDANPQVNAAASYDKTSVGLNSPCYIPLITEVTQSFQSTEPSENLYDAVKASDAREQACLRILALKEITHFSQLVPLLRAMNGQPLKGDDNPGNPTCTVHSNIVTELALEAALAQEFPEPIAIH